MLLLFPRWHVSICRYKLKNVKDGPTVFLNREKGREQQCRKLCKKCNLLVAYVSEPDTDKVYLVDGALLPEGAR